MRIKGDHVLSASFCCFTFLYYFQYRHHLRQLLPETRYSLHVIVDHYINGVLLKLKKAD